MSILQDAFDAARGKPAAQRAEQAQLEANQQALEETRRATEQALGFFSPFEGLGQEVPQLLQYLLDPNQQIQELQQNPLLELATQNLNEQTLGMAAARGRLSAGDTMSQLQNNLLLAAQPLLDRRRQDVSGLLNLQQGLSGAQGNIAIGQGAQVADLLGNVGNIRAAQDIGTMNQTNQLIQGILQAAGSAMGGMGGMGGAGGSVGGAGGAGANASGLFSSGAMFSDNRLKKNIKQIGKGKEFNLYEWEWNDEAENNLGLKGKAKGYLYNDVAQSRPDAVSQQSGYGVVHYDKLGVNYGS